MFMLFSIALGVTGQNLVRYRTGNIVSGDYTTEGTVHLEAFDDGSLNLRFENDYLTQSNVYDVHIFLTNNNNYNSPIDTTGMLLVENIGTINGSNYSSGARIFSLPSNVGINDFQHLVFICVQYGRLHWADASFGTEMNAVTNVEDTDLEELFHVYPNPSADGKVFITSEIQGGDVSVFDATGKMIKRVVLNANQKSIFIKESGIYFIRFSTNDGVITRKVLVS